MNILTYQALFEFQTNPSGFFKWEGAHKHTFVEYVLLRVHTVTLILILTINKTSTKPLPTQTNSASENLRKVSSDASLVRSPEGISSCASSPTLQFPNNVPSCQSRQVATIEYHSVAIEKSTQHCYWLELNKEVCTAWDLEGQWASKWEEVEEGNNDESLQGRSWFGSMGLSAYGLLYTSAFMWHVRLFTFS